MNNSIFYSKERKLSFDVLRIKLTNIPILIAEKLSIYQKYTILLLNEGVVADNRNDLVYKIAKALNIKNSFILEFIEMLSNLNYIVFEKNKYILSEKYKIIVDEKDGTIMRANIGVENADCEDVYYIPLLNKFYDVSYFEENKLDLTKDSNEDEFDETSVKKSLSENKEEIERIIKLNFDKKEYVLCNNFTFDVSDIIKYKLSLNVLYHYEYDGTISKMKDIIYDEKLGFSKDVIYKCGEKYLEDDKLPRFIEYKEKFYETYSDYEQVIDNLIEKESSNEVKIVELEENIKDKQIKIIEQNKKIKQLSVDNQNDIDKLNLINDNLIKELDLIKEQLKNTRIELNNVQKEKNKIEKEQEILLNNNKKILNPIINNVFNKFSKYEKFNNKINLICLHIDQALSALDCESYDNLFNSISQARVLYGQTFKAIFDVVFEKNEEKLVSYYNPVNYQNKIEEKIKSKKFDIKLITFEGIKKMHTLFNKDAHGQEIDMKSSFSKDDFKKESKENRYKILISIIEFLDGLSLNDSQYKEINKKLTEK